MNLRDLANAYFGHVVSAWLVVATTAALAGDSGTRQNVLDSLIPKPALVLYVVSDGKPANVKLLAFQLNRNEIPRLMIRAFDGGENLIYWNYYEPGRISVEQEPSTGDCRCFGIQE